MTNVLITGGTGSIGSHLKPLLEQAGYTVKNLSRSPGDGDFMWDVQKGYLEVGAIEWADHVIHLAGAGINDKRWTKARKEVLWSSRVDGTKLLVDRVQHGQIKTLLAASGIGYYGNTQDSIGIESDPPATDFLGELSKAWEAASLDMQQKGARVVLLRTGIALDKHSGALPVMTLPLKFGLAPVPLDGSQHLPWIHMKDLCRLYVHALQHESWTGPYNGAAPELATNRMIMRALVKVMQRPALSLNTPAFLLKLALGEISQYIFYDVRLSSQKAIDAGFEFEFPELELALKDLYK
jgi:uncharacterized protein (TIGR01777 family)